MNKVVLIRSRDGKQEERVSWNDLNATFNRNFQISSSFEVSFTMTYSSEFSYVYNLAKEKAFVLYDDETYVIQQIAPVANSTGLMQKQVTASHIVLDKLKNLRVDANPESTTTNTSGSSDTSSSSDGDNQSGTTVVTKPTDQVQTYSFESQLKRFFDNNDQEIGYALHGSFPNLDIQASDGTALDFLSLNASSYGAIYIPHGNTLDIYNYSTLENKTDKTFRYLSDMTEASISVDVNDLVNFRRVYAGKMETTTTTVNGTTTTTTADYYQTKFDYRDDESIATYGLHRGAPLMLDSVYDEDNARKTARLQTQSNPSISLSLQSTGEDGRLGDAIYAVVPEMNISAYVMLVGVSGNDLAFNSGASVALTFNNNNEALKDINHALFQDIHEIKNDFSTVNNHVASLGSRIEDHFGRILGNTAWNETEVKAFDNSQSS